MPNFLKKLFRRKPTDATKSALVDKNDSSRNKGKGRTSQSHRNARRGDSAIKEPEKPLGAAKSKPEPLIVTSSNSMTKNSAISPTSKDPPGKNRTSPRRSPPAANSSSLMHNSGAPPPFEVEHSTTSTAKTSDRGSPVQVPHDEQEYISKLNSQSREPRHSPRLVDSKRVSSSPRNAMSPKSRGKGGPVDIDEAADEENFQRRTSNNLRNSSIPVYAMDGTNSASPSHVLLNKPPEAMNDDNSSLNLSTDVSDTEYENLRKGIVPPSALDKSNLSATYNTDGDTSIFPNLVDDEPTPKDAFGPAWDTQDFATPNSAPITGNVSGFPSNAASATSPQDFFKSSRPKVEEKKPQKSSDPFPQDSFADFANFANFDDSNWGQSAGPSPKSAPRSSSRPKSQPDSANKSSRVYIETGRVKRAGSSSNHGASSVSMSTKETSLTELLAQAKSKSTSSRRSTSSVNSAPVVSSYRRRDGTTMPLKIGSRSIADGGAAASVSDIMHNLHAADKSRDGGSVKSAKERLRRRRQQKENEDTDEAAESWLFDEVTGALGPRGIAADLESLSGRSQTSGGGRSHKSHRSKSKRRSRRASSGESVNSKDSRRSRSSRYSHKSTRSYISQMSEQSRSVANDLLRLEMQLAMVGQGGQSNNNGDDKSQSNRSHRSTRSRAKSSARSIGSTARRSRITVMAPPGKLGIILANKADSKGTVVSGVRTSSVLAEKISPGDRIVAIDGEDVSLMTVSEITTIMARKADYERTLTVLTAPRSMVDSKF